MKILVTGCSGFIGNHVVRHALSVGFEVVGVDCVKSNIYNPMFKFYHGDIRDRYLINTVIDGCDYVIHLAAESNIAFFKDNLQKNYEVNINGFLNVIDAAYTHKCKKLLYASSAAIYTDDVFSEDVVLDAKQKRNHYGRSKLIDEILAQSFAETTQLPVIGCRFMNVYGPGEHTKGEYACAVTKFVIANCKKQQLVIYGDGTQSKDFIYIDDLITILFKLFDVGQTGVYNIGSGTTVSFNRIAELIDNQHIHKYIPIPLEVYIKYTKADITKLLNVVGRYDFISIEDGIQRLKRYYDYLL